MVQREVNRFYQPYKNAQSRHERLGLVEKLPTDPGSWTDALVAHRPQHSSDRALTAFAQLCTLRLNVRRCLISLLDSKHQYVLTEATRTLSLSRHTIDKDDDRVWLGKAVVDKNDLLCVHMFGSTYTAVDEDGTSHTADGMVIPDMTKNDKFKNKPYVLGEPHIRFYAGVPIRTRDGHIIGAYACSSNVARPQGLSVAELRFMTENAAVVMEHLEMIRDREDRTKGERMVRGLSDFIEGSCSIGKPTNPSAPPFKSPSASKNAPETIIEAADESHGANGTTTKASVLKRQSENLKSMASEEVELPEDDDLAPLERKVSRTTGRRIVQPPPSNPNCIFYRAADIIRKSTLADGAVFFRTPGPNLRIRSPSHPAEDSSVEESQSQTSGSENPAATIAHRREATSPKTQKFTTQKAPKPVDSENTKVCEVLGLSVEEDVLDQGRLGLADFKFLETSMEKYIRKFPHGKFFSFTETGSGLSSGETESEVEPIVNPPYSTNGHKNSTDNVNKIGARGKRQKFIPTELLKFLPGVRTLIFLPLWDTAAERWIAGGFIWTSHAGTLLSPNHELPYLKAFGNSITSEYARINAMRSDAAKSDFISSISHEMRSPLHGILGSAEFVSDTELTPYQAGLITNVHTSAKTLLETLEHVLDYAKINKLYNRDRNSRRPESKLRKREEGSVVGLTADVDLHRLLEEVCEASCSGHAYRESHAEAGSLTQDGQTEGVTNLSHLKVSLEIAPRLTNLVRTQPGAIRRIVLNLLGNSLKYTNTGYVAVKMRGRPVQGDPSRIEVIMTFADSGKGMSIEFQKTRMFSPFSQEDPYADGTGLGLSIVRQIVDSLGGHIDIKSTKGVGTTVEVHLTLPVAGEQPDHFANVRALTQGKRILLVDGDSYSKDLSSCKSAFDQNSLEWFGLGIGNLGSKYGEHQADGLLCHESSANFCQLAVGSTPLMVVCNNQSNQIALRRRLMSTLPPCSRSNVHIIAQPLGPHKLAAAFSYMFAERTPCSEGPGKNVPETAIGMSQRDTKSSIDILQPLYRPAPPTKTHLSEMMQPKKVVFERLDRAQSEPAQPMEQQAPESDVGQVSNVSLPESPATKHNVLLVDDNRINLNLLAVFMKKLKIQYTCAKDGLEALEAYKANVNGNSVAAAGCNFTYILTDLSMPVMDGIESTRRIREFERECGASKAIIIALTGLGSLEAQQAAVDAGVDYYIPKPVKFADLKRLMNM